VSRHQKGKTNLDLLEPEIVKLETSHVETRQRNRLNFSAVFISA